MLLRSLTATGCLFLSAFLASCSCSETNLNTAKSSAGGSVSSVIGAREVQINLSDDLKLKLDDSLKLKLKLKLKSPRHSPAATQTNWALVGILPDGTRYTASANVSGTVSLSLPTNQILSLFIEETCGSYSNAMPVSYPDGSVSFRNGPSASGDLSPIVLGSPVLTDLEYLIGGESGSTDTFQLIAAAQPDSNISTAGSGKIDAGYYTNFLSLDRYSAGILDIYPVIDADQDGIPDIYEYASGIAPKPASGSGGVLDVCSSTNTNSPGVVLALTVDPTTLVYTNSPAWTNAQVRFALDGTFNSLRTNYLSVWTNAILTVVLSPAFSNTVSAGLSNQWSNAAAAVVTILSFSNSLSSNLYTPYTNLLAAVSTNAAWAQQAVVFQTNSPAAQVAGIEYPYAGATVGGNFDAVGNLNFAVSTNITITVSLSNTNSQTNAPAPAPRRKRNAQQGLGVATITGNVSILSNSWQTNFSGLSSGGYILSVVSVYTDMNSILQTVTNQESIIVSSGLDGINNVTDGNGNGVLNGQTVTGLPLSFMINDSTTMSNVVLYIDGVQWDSSIFYSAFPIENMFTEYSLPTMQTNHTFYYVVSNSDGSVTTSPVYTFYYSGFNSELPASDASGSIYLVGQNSAGTPVLWVLSFSNLVTNILASSGVAIAVDESINGCVTIAGQSNTNIGFWESYNNSFVTVPGASGVLDSLENSPDGPYYTACCQSNGYGMLFSGYSGNPSDYLTGSVGMSGGVDSSGNYVAFGGAGTDGQLIQTNSVDMVLFNGSMGRPLVVSTYGTYYYVAGTNGSGSVLWYSSDYTNWYSLALNSGAASILPGNISYCGAQVYVAGTSSGIPGFWLFDGTNMNNIPWHPLPCSSTGTCTTISVDPNGGNIYAAGEDGNQACLWIVNPLNGLTNRIYLGSGNTKVNGSCYYHLE
jgi:hypothetical protein